MWFHAPVQGIEELWQRYGERGLVVLGFPCNQFGGQEPDSEAQIATFCERRFGVSFPLFAKVEVNGGDAHPLFIELKKRAPGLLGSKAIKWNFTKFLIADQGARCGAIPRVPRRRHWRRISRRCSETRAARDR